MRGPIRALREHQARKKQLDDDYMEIYRQFFCGELDADTVRDAETILWAQVMRRTSFRQAATLMHQLLNPPLPDLLIDEEDDLPWTAKTLHK